MVSLVQHPEHNVEYNWNKNNVIIQRYDLACVQTNWQWAMCTGCWLPNSFYSFVEIKIRGLCSRSKFDTIYDVMNDPTGYVSYKGMKNTEVTYNPLERQWIMKLVNNPNMLGVSNASIDSLLMGRCF